MPRAPCRATCERHCAAGQSRKWTRDLDVVEISRNLRRTAFTDRNASVSSGAAVENISRKIVQLNLAIGGDDLRARLAHVHASQHTATDAQVR